MLWSFCIWTDCNGFHAASISGREERERKKKANTVYYMYNLYLMHLNSCAEYETEIVMGSN